MITKKDMKRTTLASNQFITLVKLSTDSGFLAGYELFRTRDNAQHNLMANLPPFLEEPTLLKSFDALTDTIRLYGPRLRHQLVCQIMTGQRIKTTMQDNALRDMSSPSCIKKRARVVSKRKSL
jgi:hypothetical protein